MRLAGRHRGPDIAGMDDRHRHPRALQLGAEPFEERGQPGLRRRVARRAGEAAVAGQAADSDDLSRPAAQHIRQDALDRHRGRLEVDVNHPGEVGGREVPARNLDPDPSVGHQQVDGPEVPDDPPDGCGGRLRVGRVRRRDLGGPTFAADLGCNPAQFDGPPRGQTHLPPVARQLPGDLRAQAARRPGDDRYIPAHAHDRCRPRRPPGDRIEPQNLSVDRHGRVVSSLNGS